MILTSFGNTKYLIISLLRISIAVLFIFSGIEKIINPAAFAEAISKYRLLPDLLINLAALTLPWIELVAGILIFFDCCTKECSFIITVLMFAFTVAVVIAFARGLNIECGCFGTLNSSKVSLFKIFENILITSVTLFFTYYSRKNVYGSENS